MHRENKRPPALVPKYSGQAEVAKDAEEERRGKKNSEKTVRPPSVADYCGGQAEYKRSAFIGRNLF
jgi:hypothetical protein